MPYVKMVKIPNPTLFEDLGLESVLFHVRGLPDHKITIWIETYRNEELQERLTWGAYRIPYKGEAVEEDFRFSCLRRPGEMGSQVMWTFGFCQTRWPSENVDTSYRRGWMEDPMRDTMIISTTSDRQAKLIVGEPVTVWEAEGCAFPVWGASEFRKENPFVLTIKCRMDAPSLEEVTEAQKGSVSGFLEGQPEAVPQTTTQRN